MSEEIADFIVSDIARNKSATVREVADKTVARPIQIREEVDKSAGLLMRTFYTKCALLICAGVNSQTPHFRTYSRRALFDLPKLCIMVELVVLILKGVNHFSIQFIVFPLGGKMLIFGH